MFMIVYTYIYTYVTLISKEKRLSKLRVGSWKVLKGGFLGGVERGREGRKCSTSIKNTLKNVYFTNL